MIGRSGKATLKGRPRILTVLLQQIYKEYHRFTDGELLEICFNSFPTSKMAPQMMTEETDQKLEEMTAMPMNLVIQRPSSLIWIGKKTGL